MSADNFSGEFMEKFSKESLAGHGSKEVLLLEWSSSLFLSSNDIFSLRLA